MADPALRLKDLTPAREFFVGIDSDGCVFDTMEIKHKECFCPCFILHFDLQPVSRYAREVWEFVNLYSVNRGVNRFKAVPRALDLLARRPEVAARRAAVRDLQGVKAWAGRESRLSNTALQAELAARPDADLRRAYEWSLDVNRAIERMVRNVPPFPRARESLARLGERADIIVVSQTPLEALEREWEEHGLRSLARAIAGQEMGTKTEHIALAGGGKYPAGKMLMIGDAPGDLEAARRNGTLFYPVVPGREDESWKRFFEEALDRFFAGTYAGGYEEALVREFNRRLPGRPPWEQAPLEEST